MRVAFDTSATLFDPGGTTRYIRALAERGALFRGVEVVEVSIAFSWPWVRRLSRRALIRVHDLLWVRRGVERAALGAGADLLHGPAFRVPATTRLLTAVTLHDDTPWDDPPTASWWTRTSLRRCVKSATRTLSVATVSNHHVADAVTRAVPALEGRVRVTPFGVDHDVFGPRGADEVAGCLRRLGCPSRYALAVGGYGARKNLPAMFEALRAAGAAARGMALVITGRIPVRSSPTGFPVRYVGHVSDADLACLYSGAQFLLYASLKEGFGFPVLEAMACGCPVLTSRDPALEELAGGAALHVEAGDVTALTRGCTRLLDDWQECERLRRIGLERAARFSWDEAIAETAAAWLEAMAQSRDGSWEARRRHREARW